jgi:hypothetical protein
MPGWSKRESLQKYKKLCWAFSLAERRADDRRKQGKVGNLSWPRGPQKVTFPPVTVVHKSKYMHGGTCTMHRISTLYEKVDIGEISLEIRTRLAVGQSLGQGPAVRGQSVHGQLILTSVRPSGPSKTDPVRESYYKCGPSWRSGKQIHAKFPILVYILGQRILAWDTGHLRLNKEFSVCLFS